MSQAEDGRPPVVEVDVLGRSFALAALLLPVMGVLVRIAAFTSSDFYIPLRAAWSVPVAELVTTGLPSQAAVMLLVWFYGQIGELAPSRHRIVEETKRQTEEYKSIVKDLEGVQHELEAASGEEEASAAVVNRVRDIRTRVNEVEAASVQTESLLRSLVPKDRKGLFGWIDRHFKWMFPLLLLSGALVFLSVSFWVAVSLGLATFVGAGVIASVGRRRGRLTLGTTWYAFLLAMLLGAVGFGLAGLVYVPVARYTFAADTGLQAGYYVLLADAGNSYLLVNCAGTRRVSEVVKSQVTLAEYPTHETHATAPELWSVLLGRDRVQVGVRLDCPAE